MAADHARRLAHFDLGHLGLDLRKSEDYAQDRVASTDPWHPTWCLDWGVTSVHLSASVMCVTVQPRRWSSLAVTAREARETCKEELRTLLRFVANLAAEYGLLRPVAGMLLLDACDSDSEEEWVDVIGAWAGEQDWHRGEFLLFVETDRQQYCRRCLDLLAPAPDAWTRIEPPAPRTASEVLEVAKKSAGNDELRVLLDELKAAVESDDAASGRENPITRRFSEWLNAKLDPVDRRLHWDVPGPDASRGEGGDRPRQARPIRHPGNIARITKLRIRNFRGFGSRDDEPFDLDADLVLLTGPNGLGKTSLIEALDLLLTGYHHFRDDPHHLFHFGAETFELAGTVRVEPGGPASESRTLTITCTGRRERDGAGWKPPAIAWSVNGGNEETGSAIVRPLAQEFQRRFGEETLSIETARRTEELLSRRTAVYPDRLDKLFDETTTGATLRDYLDPLHPVIGEFLDAMTKKEGGARQHLSDWSKNIRREADEPDVETPREAVEAALKMLRAHYELLAEPYGELPEPDGWPPLPLSSDDHALSNLVKGLLARRGESVPETDLPDRLPGVLEALHREELRRSDETATEKTAPETAERIVKDIEQCEARLKEIDQRYPRLDDDLEAFNAGTANPGLLAILESLRDHAPVWRASAEARSGSLPMLATELRRVRAEDAAKCASELRSYLDPRRQGLEERNRLRTEHASLQVALRRARHSERARELTEMRTPLLDTASGLRDAWLKVRKIQRQQELAARAQGTLDSLDVLAGDVDRLIGCIDGAVAASESLRESVAKLANGVLARLAPMGGPLRVALSADEEGERAGAGTSGSRRRFTVTTEDRRDRVVLSFGQRTQVGVAMVIAENRLLEAQLGHRVFLMDDLSATYDLANLSRDAIFWRQMAYGSGAQAGTRQVFLSSHHEDLSNRLLDVMPPVEGRRMLLYRFTGWKKGTGPDFEVHDVQSQPALDAPLTGPEGGQDDRRDFAQWLQDQLTETVDASA